MKKIYPKLALLLGILCIITSTTATEVANIAPNATTTPVTNTSATRLWNLQDADIISVINEVSLETGKNFVIDPRVSGKISLISSKPLKPEEVYNVFLSV